jgi:hypothetical protein
MLDDAGINEGIETSVSDGGAGVPVTWYTFLSQLEAEEVPVLVVGQEFLDTFPV